MVAEITSIDVEAASVLPSMSNLKVANPRLAVEGALFLVRVQFVDITPTSPLVMFSLNAFVGQVIEIRREASFEHVAINTNDFAK